MHDWRASIITLSSLKNDLWEVDKEKIWKNELPNKAATANEINELEGNILYPVCGDYVDFLSLANGWRSFFVGMDLFGTNELVSGAQKLAGENLINALEPNIWDDMKVPRNDLYPIAILFDC